MNPLAITPAFTGEIEIPQAALLEREEVVTASKQITGVSSQEELEQAVSALRDLTGLEKVTESGRTKEKRPFLDFSKLIDSFAAKFIAPVTEEKARITGYVNEWQRKEAMRKQAEAREAAEKQRKADEAAAAAQKKIDDQQREIERLSNLPITTRDGLLIRDGEVIQLPEADKVAKKAGYKHAEEMVRALEKQMKDAQAAKLANQLAAEEASMAKQSAAIVPVANTPMGLATRVSYDFEIIDPHKLIAKKPALFRWKAGEEAFHFDRAGFRQLLNSATPNEYTAWRPPEDAEGVVMSNYGVRVFVSVKTNVRA